MHLHTEFAMSQKLEQLEFDLAVAKKLIRARALPSGGELPKAGIARKMRPVRIGAEDYGYAGLHSAVKNVFEPGEGRNLTALRLKGGSLLAKELCAMAIAKSSKNRLAFVNFAAPFDIEKSPEVSKAITELWDPRCGRVVALVLSGLEGGRRLGPLELAAIRNVFLLCRAHCLQLIWFTDIPGADNEPEICASDGTAVYVQGDADNRARLISKNLWSPLYEGYCSQSDCERLGAFAKDAGEAACLAHLAVKYGGQGAGKFTGADLIGAVKGITAALRRESDPLRLASLVSGMYYGKSCFKDGALCLADGRRDDDARPEFSGAARRAPRRAPATQAQEAQSEKTIGRIYTPPEQDLFDERLVCSQDSISDFTGIMKALSDTLKGGGSIPAHAGTALLYGPPGTGKTEFAEHLGAMIGRETVVVTGADLLRSKWGKTEKLIQDVFDDAKAKGRLLVIDEVDYLMHSRGRSRKGNDFESSMVDQFLAVMGAYEGLFIATTNNSKIIDAAVKRRFSHSFAFTYANQEQLELLWDKYLSDCAESAIAKAEKERLFSLGRLTPGEFLNVRNGHDPQFGGKKASAAKLLLELEELSRFRDGKKKRKEGVHRRIGMI